MTPPAPPTRLDYLSTNNSHPPNCQTLESIEKLVDTLNTNPGCQHQIDLRRDRKPLYVPKYVVKAWAAARYSRGINKLLDTS
jgi:hypothetical protein